MIEGINEPSLKNDARAYVLYGFLVIRILFQVFSFYQSVCQLNGVGVLGVVTSSTHDFEVLAHRPLLIVLVVAHLYHLEHNGKDHSEVHHELLRMHIEHFNARVDTQAVEHQQNANNGNEYQRQNLHFGMGVDEVGDGIDEHHHKENCEHNRQ